MDTEVEKVVDKSMPRVLLIEDSDSDAFIVQKALYGGMDDTHCTRAITLKDGEDILEKGQTDLLLLDLGLPDSVTPADTYARVKKWADKVPVVIMTSLKDHALARALVRDGAADFLNKDSILENPKHIQHVIDFSMERHALTRKIMQESKDKDSTLSYFMGGYSITK